MILREPGPLCHARNWLRPVRACTVLSLISARLIINPIFQDVPRWKTREGMWNLAVAEMKLGSSVSSRDRVCFRHLSALRSANARPSRVRGCLVAAFSRLTTVAFRIQVKLHGRSVCRRLKVNRTFKLSDTGCSVTLTFGNLGQIGVNETPIACRSSHRDHRGVVPSHPMSLR